MNMVFIFGGIMVSIFIGHGAVVSGLLVQASFEVNVGSLILAILGKMIMCLAAGHCSAQDSERSVTLS